MTFSPPATSALPDELIDSPAPTAPPYGILSVATPFKPEGPTTRDGLPSGAVRIRHQRCVQTDTWPNCPPSSFDTDPDVYPTMDGPVAGDDGYRFYPVTGYTSVGCSMSALHGDTLGRWVRWGEEDLEAATPHFLEEFLWYKASLPSVQGSATVMPSLAAVASVVGDPDAPVNPRDGIARLLSVYHDCNQGGGNAVLHVPDILGQYLADHGVIRPIGNKMVTATGVAVVIGTGYPERIGPANLGSNLAIDDPDPTPDDDDGVWVIVSGPIQLALGKPELTADVTGAIRASGRIPQGLYDARTGEQEAFIRRRAYFAFDTCCVRAMRVRAVNVTAEVG